MAEKQDLHPLLSRIVQDERVMGGKPCVRGTRVTVATLLSLLAAGTTREAILRDYWLQPEDISAALLYAAWRMGEFEYSIPA